MRAAPTTPAAERLAAWAADPRTIARIRRAVWVLIVAGLVGILAKGGSRPADPYLTPPTAATTTVPGGGPPGTLAGGGG